MVTNRERWLPLSNQPLTIQRTNTRLSFVGINQHLSRFYGKPHRADHHRVTFSFFNRSSAVLVSAGNMYCWFRDFRARQFMNGREKSSMLRALCYSVCTVIQPAFIAAKWNGNLTITEKLIHQLSSSSHYAERR